MKMKTKILTVMVALALPGLAGATGYVVDPPARSLQCKQGENLKCGNSATYSADGIVAAAHASGFPADGEIASGGLNMYSPLNIEGEEKWNKTLVDKGKISISWQLTSPSKITQFAYFLTKPNWQKTLDGTNRLTRSSFADSPFCVVEGSSEPLQGLVTHECLLPESQGYQLVYAVANYAKEADGTNNTLYNIIDIDIDNVKLSTNPLIHSIWNKEIATIDREVLGTPITVHAGQTIRVRLFSNEGELTDLETHATPVAGEELYWSYAVAKAINARHSDIRAGVLHEDGNVYPEKDQINSIYTKSTSPLIHAEISFN
jgi:chitin-binding protein